MEEKDLLEMPIEIINPGNGLPEAPTCAPCGAGIPCYDDYANFGCGVVICDRTYLCGYSFGAPSCPTLFI